MKQKRTETPVRASLQDSSRLHASVVDGIGALKAPHRACIDASVRNTFADSIDIDNALKEGREQDHRWDYLLGHGGSDAVIALEPHSAKHDEISTVIKKRSAARDQLAEHLRPGRRVAKWLWVASGRVQFADTEKIRRVLDQNGIEFVGTRVMARHLPELPVGGQREERARPRRIRGRS